MRYEDKLFKIYITVLCMCIDMCMCIYIYICARGYTQISMKLCSKKLSEERSTKSGWVVVLSSPEFLIPVELLVENVTHLLIFGSLIGDISCQGIVDCLNIGNHISWFLIIIQGCSKHPRYVWGVSWVNIEIKLPISPEWDYNLPSGKLT